MCTYSSRKTHKTGEASPDPDMPDYVPSVFTSPKQRPNPKRKRVEWIYRFKKRRRRAANAGTESGFRCDLCHQTLKDISEFINHYQLHHVQPPTVTDEPPEMAEATGNGEEPATADAMETSETKDREAPAVGAPVHSQR
ncbi:hypothetical protein FQA47_021528 [Oryzias melastigma]|uniref:C2H2-type domain-containing protein n=1 Tax=Oryzias melastigma TaxID=30732 RepID=A0A834F161_ORYME|nr:hypothetical protein FQA47_021528 [Oryzias melastigma]